MAKLEYSTEKISATIDEINNGINGTLDNSNSLLLPIKRTLISGNLISNRLEELEFKYENFSNSLIQINDNINKLNKNSVEGVTQTVGYQLIDFGTPPNGMMPTEEELRLANDLLNNMGDDLDDTVKLALIYGLSLVGKVEYHLALPSTGWGKFIGQGWNDGNQLGRYSTSQMEWGVMSGNGEINGLDCSGFVTWSLYQVAYESGLSKDEAWKLMNSTEHNYNAKERILIIEGVEPIPGDLLTTPSEGHIVMYVGKDSSGQAYIVESSMGKEYNHDGVQIKKYNPDEYKYIYRPKIYDDLSGKVSPEKVQLSMDSQIENNINAQVNDIVDNKPENNAPIPINNPNESDNTSSNNNNNNSNSSDNNTSSNNNNSNSSSSNASSNNNNSNSSDNNTSSNNNDSSSDSGSNNAPSENNSNYNKTNTNDSSKTNNNTSTKPSVSYSTTSKTKTNTVIKQPDPVVEKPSEYSTEWEETYPIDSKPEVSDFINKDTNSTPDTSLNNNTVNDEEQKKNNAGLYAGASAVIGGGGYFGYKKVKENKENDEDESDEYSYEEDSKEQEENYKDKKSEIVEPETMNNNMSGIDDMNVGQYDI